MISIEHQILKNTYNAPEKVALISGGVSVSYAELWHKSLCVANSLQDKYGVKNGDRVILAATGNIDFVYTYLGVHIAGGIAVPIDPDTNETRFRYIYDKTSPKLIAGCLYSVNDFKVTPFDVLRSDAPAEYVAPDLNATADILFTTGTTGTPKGVTLSYCNLAAAANHINTFIENTEDDVEIIALPVSHSFGLGRVRCVLSKGGTLVMLGTFANIKRFFREIERYNVTGFGMVPTSWEFIKRMSGRYISKFADQLHYIEIGSSFMSVDDKKMLMDLLPNTRICMHYGLTEASRSAYMEFHAEKDNLSTVGKAAYGVDIALFSADGTKVGVGEEGEVCVKGKHVCCGYWTVPHERFQQDFYDDYFRTGDSGVMDVNGNLYLKSRLKEMINVGGKKVAPMEVEDMLNQMPNIKECACIGISDPDGIMGEVVKAFYVSETEIDCEQIKDFLTNKLEVYKIPVVFERVGSIPKTASGKIQRFKLNV